MPYSCPSCVHSWTASILPKAIWARVVVTICYAAEELGLGSLIIGLYDREKLCSLLNIPIEKQFAGLIAVGYPANGNVRPKQRRQMEEIVRFI